jgi:hypothetical protein
MGLHVHFGEVARLRDDQSSYKFEADIQDVQ